MMTPDEKIAVLSAIGRMFDGLYGNIEAYKTPYDVLDRFRELMRAELKNMEEVK